MKSGRTLLLFFFCSTVYAVSSEFKAAIKECVADKNQQQCIDLLKTEKGIPDEENALIKNWVLKDKQPARLRHYLIKRFSSSLSNDGSEMPEKSLRRMLLDLTRAQFHYLAGKNHHSNEDLETIKLSLQMASRARLRELFYDIVP